MVKQIRPNLYRQRRQQAAKASAIAWRVAQSAAVQSCVGLLSSDNGSDSKSKSSKSKSK